MRTIVLSVLLPLAVAAVALAAPAPFHRPERPGRGDDLARLQGTWMLDSCFSFREGVWVKLASSSHPLVIRGDRFAWEGSFAPKALVETVTLHKGPYPRGIDFIPPDASGVERAAYAIEGDTLTIVLPFTHGERASFERAKYKLVYRRKR
jgi:uncharacterized protein (TIGR03067 family)